jgi:oligopeptide/dipeptide ABC transporter ATP-binding protein
MIDPATSSELAAAAAPAPEDEEPIVVVENLVKYYPIYGGILRRKIGDVKAVDGVSFEIKRGEVFGLVGESGCGKSTLGRTLVRLIPATSGTATLNGEDIFSRKGDDLKKFRRQMQIIFQDPVGSLNPRMPVSEIIGEGLLAQADKENGWGNRKVRDKRVGDYLDAVGLRRDYARRYPHEFSGGQRQRIGIARALALAPQIVICDEPVSALDVSIQSQILNLLLDLRAEFDLTYLFVAHNLSVIQYISDRVGVMYLGTMVEVAGVEEIYSNPRHPYTIALLSAVPEPNPRIRKRRIVLKGDVPSPAAPPSGCRFHTRCWLREQLGRPEACETTFPELRVIAGGHRVACHFAETVTPEAAAEAAHVVVPVALAVEGIAAEAPLAAIAGGEVEETESDIAETAAAASSATVRDSLTGDDDSGSASGRPPADDLPN